MSIETRIEAICANRRQWAIAMICLAAFSAAVILIGWNVILPWKERVLARQAEAAKGAYAKDP